MTAADIRGSRAPSHPTLSVVIVNWNGADLLEKCLISLERQHRPVDEIVVVDNGSVDHSVELVRQRFPEVRLVLLPVNTGFAGGANAGISVASSEWIALLNNDVVVAPDWTASLMRAAETADARVGYVTSKILDADGATIDSAGDYLDLAFTAHQRGHQQPANDPRWDLATPIGSACAAATAYRRQLFEEVGVFDERFFAYFEDVDLCLRAGRRGWTGWYEPSAVVRHATSSTSSRVPGFKRYQGTRNAWWLMYKHLPGELAARVVPRFLLTQLIWLWSAARQGELRSALRGHASGLFGLPRLRQDRRSIARTSATSATEFARDLAPPVAIHQAWRRLRAVRFGASS